MKKLVAMVSLAAVVVPLACYIAVACYMWATSEDLIIRVAGAALVALAPPILFRALIKRVNR